MWDRFISQTLKFPILMASVFATVIPIAIGFFRYKYLSKENKILLYYLVVYFLLDLDSLWLNLNRKSNIFNFNFSELLEISVICYVFFQLNTTKIKRIFTTLLFFVCIIIGIWKFDFVEFSYFPYTINRLSYLVLVFTYFDTLLAETSVKNILIHSPFWLCAGLIIYSTGSLLIFLFGKQIFSINAPDELFIQFYTLVSIINIIFRLLLGVSFFVSKYEKL